MRLGWWGRHVHIASIVPVLLGGTTMAALEGTDEFILLRRAAELSGRSPKTLHEQAMQRRLRTVKLGYNRLTTRRWLHEYLMQAGAHAKERFRPIPEDYAPPE
jgi:hypothetical protein